eukprot:755264-Hanusia_phi.AAC.3
MSCPPRSPPAASCSGDIRAGGTAVSSSQLSRYRTRAPGRIRTIPRTCRTEHASQSCDPVADEQLRVCFSYVLPSSCAGGAAARPGQRSRHTSRRNSRSTGGGHSTCDGAGRQQVT